MNKFNVTMVFSYYWSGLLGIERVKFSKSVKFGTDEGQDILISYFEGAEVNGHLYRHSGQSIMDTGQY